MAKKLNVNLAFSADTGNAKAEIQALQNQLTNLINTASTKGNFSLNTDLQQSTEAAIKLKTQLQSATNVKTGNLNLTKFTQELDKSGMNLEKYRIALEDLGPEGSETFSKLAQAITTAEVPIANVNSKLAEFATTLKNTARWQISSSIMHGFMGTLQSAYGYAQNLDRSLNNIRIVTGQSSEQMAEFAERANQAAKELKTTTTAYTNASLIYYQQGLSDEEVKERTDTTIKMANVTGENASAVSDYMTAIWNNFDNGSVSLEHYADVITALGAATASSSEEIAGGLEKFASIADTVGLSYDYATTALATIVAQTRQSEDTVGTGLRTILSRFSNVTLGETLEDGVDLTKYTKALKTIGVDVLDNNGELKTMDEILDSIGENWQNISDTQKTALAQTVGGVRQYTTIMSLFDNWDVFKENLSVAQGSEGSLQEQADIYAESWQAAEKRVRASAEAIYQDLLDDKFFIAMNNGFAGILDIIDKTIDSLGGLKGVLLLVGSIVTRVFQKQIGESIGNSINFVKSLTKSGRQHIENTRREATEQLTRSAIDQATNEGEALSVGYEQQANLQDAYLNNVTHMDETQKSIAKSLMQQQQILIKNVKLAGQEADEMDKQAILAKRKIESYSNLMVEDENTKASIKKNVRDIETVTTSENAAASIVRKVGSVDVSKLAVGNKGLNQAITELKSYSSIIDNVKDKVLNFQGAFAESAESTDFYTQKLVPFQEALKEVESTAEPTEEQLEKLKTTMDNLIAATDASPGAYISAQSLKSQLMNKVGFNEKETTEFIKDMIDANAKLGESYVKVAEKQSILEQYTSKVSEKFNKLKNNNVTFGESISEITSVLSSLGLAFSSTMGLIDTVFDSEVSNGQKIISTLTTLGMVIPTIIKAVNAESVAHLKNAAAKTIELAATHPLLAAGIALVGVITAGIIAYQNQETELDRLKEKYDQVTQATQDAKTVANEMQEAYSDLSSTWDSYQTGIDKLADLTVGTREYTEALHEANQEAWELIKAQNLQKDVDYTITQDSAGNDIVSLNEENVDKILKETERQAYSAQLISNAMQVQQNIAKENLDKEEALQNAKDSVSSFDNFYTYSRTSNGGVDASGHQLTTTSTVGVRYEDKLMEIAKLLQEDDSKSSTKDLTIEDLKSIYTNANDKKLEDILNTLQDSDDEIVKLVEALNNNTDALNKSLVKEGVKGAISNKDATFAGLPEGQQNAIIDSLTNTDEYNKKYNDLLSSYGTDEIHKLYAEYLGAGAQYVKTDKDGVSTYLVNGKEQTFSDDSAKITIANKEALESLIDTNSEAYKELLAAAQEMQNNLQLSSNLKNNMLEFKGDYNANDSSTSAFDSSLINTKDNEFLTAALKEGSEERKTLYEEMGTEEAKAYLDAFQKATKDNKITPESLKAADKATYDSLADSLILDPDVDTDKLEKLTQYYEDYADAIKEVDDELKNNKYQSKQLAHEIERYSSAVADVVENYDDWKTQIKEISKKGGVLNAEDLETIEEVKNAMADMLDLDMSALSNDFVMSTENLELMKKAANGSEEAYNSLMLKAQQDIIANCSINEEEFNTAANNLENRLDELGFKKLEIGASLNDAEALEEMANLINAAGMTAEQATSYLATMGIDAEVQEDTTKKKEVIGHNLIPSVSENPIVGFNPMTGDQVTYNAPEIRYTTEPVETEKETSAFSLKVTSAQKSSGGNFKYKTVKGNSGGARSSRRRGGSRRSAPERRNATKKTTDDMKKTSEETERYHVLNNQLEDLEHQLNKISTAKDRAFGKNRLKYIDQEIKKYDQLINKDKEYLAEVEKNLKKDKAAIKAYGAVFDKNGTITNYEALMQSQINKSNSAYQQYNKQIDYYNSLSGSAQEKLDEQYEKKKDAEGNYYSGYQDYLEKTYIDPADKSYDKFLKILDRYEETQDLYKEKSEKLVEDLRAKYDLELEGVEYEIEVKVMIEDDALEYLDYLLKKVEDDAHETAEAIAILGNETQSYIAKSQLNESGIQKIFANHGLTDGDFAKFKAGDQKILDKIGSMEFTDDEVQAMRDYRSEIISLNETLIDTRNTIHDKVRDAFAEFNDELDEGINKIDTFKSITESYLNIVDLVGQKNLGISNEILNNMGQSVVNQANNKLKATVDTRDAIEAERNAAQKALEESRANGYDEDVKQWEQTLKEMDEALLEAEQNVLNAWEEALTAANEAFENSVQLAINSLNTALGGLYANADELSEAFDRQKDLDDQYLEDFEQIYELTKLTREINKAIDDTDNIKGKQELAELLAEINDLEQKREELGENISEYDLEYLQKKLELKKAEIAMEDSQNAKSQVRMSRTYDGTWSYVYTANEEEVAAAEQSYEDRLYEMQRLNADYINTLQDNIVQMQTEMVNKLQEIATDESLSIEERQEKMDEVQAYYKEKMDYYTSEMGKVMDNNKELYNEDWQEYSVAHDYKIADDQRYVDSFNETALSTLSGYETMEQFQENFNNSIGAPGQSGTYLDDLDQAFKTWEDNTEETMNNAGTSMEDFSNTMQEEVQILEDKSDEAANSVSEMSQVVVDDMQEIIDAVMNWENQYSNTVDLILTKNEALVKSFNSVLQAWAGYKQGTGTNEADETKKSSSNGSSSGNGSSKNGTGDGKPAIGDKVTFLSGSYFYDSSGTNPSGSKYHGKQVYITNLKTDGRKKPIHISTGASLGNGDLGWINKDQISGYDTGGYTGSWGDDGKLALLHEKELVLNKDDTENFLKIVGMVRQIAQVIDLNAGAANSFSLSGLIANGINGNAQTLQQEIHINAEFPNATDKDEIKAAFENLAISASQYANRNRGL